MPIDPTNPAVPRGQRVIIEVVQALSSGDIDEPLFSASQCLDLLQWNTRDVTLRLYSCMDAAERNMGVQRMRFGAQAVESVIWAYRMGFSTQWQDQEKEIRSSYDEPTVRQSRSEAGGTPHPGQ